MAAPKCKECENHRHYPPRTGDKHGTRWCLHPECRGVLTKGAISIGRRVKAAEARTSPEWCPERTNDILVPLPKELTGALSGQKGDYHRCTTNTSITNWLRGSAIRVDDPPYILASASIRAHPAANGTHSPRKMSTRGISVISVPTRRRAAAIINPKALVEACRESRLLNFYKALGWDGEQIVDPTRVILNSADRKVLVEAEMDADPAHRVEINMFWMNSGPSSRTDIPRGKVLLQEGWVTTE